MKTGQTILWDAMNYLDQQPKDEAWWDAYEILKAAFNAANVTIGGQA